MIFFLFFPYPSFGGDFHSPSTGVLVVPCVCIGNITLSSNMADSDFSRARMPLDAEYQGEDSDECKKSGSDDSEHDSDCLGHR